MDAGDWACGSHCNGVAESLTSRVVMLHRGIGLEALEWKNQMCLKGEWDGDYLSTALIIAHNKCSSNNAFCQRQPTPSRNTPYSCRQPVAVQGVVCAFPTKRRGCSSLNACRRPQPQPHPLQPPLIRPPLVAATLFLARVGIFARLSRAEAHHMDGLSTAGQAYDKGFGM
ncbi:hypothetical protein E2P81_ATG00672 [Venturia nashicola]|nr:hypothetical protein E2P81_ATG00672 [Venturia nashicola]